MQTRSLKNDGKLEIVFLGVGDAFSKNLGNTNFVAIKGNDHILVDFGITGPRTLAWHFDVNLGDIETFIPTHQHADHVGGVENLALYNHFVAQKKPNLIATEQLQASLWDKTLRGGLEWLDDVRPMQLKDYFNVITPKIHHDRRNNEAYILDHKSFHIELFRTNHINNPMFHSYGLVLDRKVYFSGDGTFNLSNIARYGRCKLMFQDCSLKPNAVHSDLEQLRRLPGCIKQKMMLVHYQDKFEEYDPQDFRGWTKAGESYIVD